LLAETQALVHVGIWEWTLVDDKLYWSDELFQILGLAPGAVPPSFEQLLAHVHPDDLTTVKSYLSRARRDRAPTTAEYRVVRPGGEIRTVQARVRTIVDAAGTPLGLIGADQDITETKELAARLVFSDRMVAVGTLAGGVAHEINTPLATISTHLQLRADSDDDADDGTRAAREAVERIRTIVRGLSAFSRADDDVRTAIDLNRVLELALAMTSHEIRHRARLVKQLGAPPPVHANEARLGHVLINLLVNAAEAIPEGNADAHTIQVTTRADAAGWASFEIRDSGAGIARPHQARIFDPFFTTKPTGQGTGLGLSICHGIVRSLGGDITFRSDPGAGSTFIISLPPSADAPRTRKRSEEHQPVTRRRGSVLIVDDEVLFATSLRRVLGGDHDVTVVHNGRDALERFRAGARYDAIVCDLMMPEMTGAELHETLSALAPDQANQMIFLTGGAFSPASQRFLERITNLCFEKPCDVDELLSAVRRRVDARTP